MDAQLAAVAERAGFLGLAQVPGVVAEVGDDLVERVHAAHSRGERDA
jgi:hypothetical protein